MFYGWCLTGLCLCMTKFPNIKITTEYDAMVKLTLVQQISQIQKANTCIVDVDTPATPKSTPC